MNSVAPVWDGNETWLVLGGGGLLAAFPLAYAVVHAGALCADHRHAAGADLPRRRLRVPLARPTRQAAAGTGPSPAARCSRPSRRAWRSAPWSRASRSPDRAYAGGWWDWLTPVQPAHRRRAGRRLCAARRHLAHHEDRRASCRTRAYRLRLDRGARHAGADRRGQPVDAVPRTPVFMARWFAWPAHPLRRAGAAAGGAGRVRCCSRGLVPAPRARAVPRGASRCSCCPTSASASASIPTSCRPRSPSGRRPRPTPASSFLLVGAVILIPLILAYTAWSYWVFRGKVDPSAGYH